MLSIIFVILGVRGKTYVTGKSSPAEDDNEGLNVHHQNRADQERYPPKMNCF